MHKFYTGHEMESIKNQELDTRRCAAPYKSHEKNNDFSIYLYDMGFD